MIEYGADVDNCQTFFTRDGKNEGSSLIYDGHKMNFKLPDVLQMVYVRKSTEDDLKYFPVVVLTSDMVYNPKELSGDYLDQNHTGARDTEKYNKFVDITMMDLVGMRSPLLGVGWGLTLWFYSNIVMGLAVHH